MHRDEASRPTWRIGAVARQVGGPIAPVRPAPEHAQALDRVAALLRRRVAEERHAVGAARGRAGRRDAAEIPQKGPSAGRR